MFINLLEKFSEWMLVGKFSKFYSFRSIRNCNNVMWLKRTYYKKVLVENNRNIYLASEGTYNELLWFLLFKKNYEI